MQRHVISPVGELPSGSTRVVVLGGRSVGVINAGGHLYALRNVCPHHGAPLCAGAVAGTMLPSEPHEYRYGRQDTVIRCPWHGYEFSLDDGRSLARPQQLRVKTYRVEVEDGEVVVYT